MPHVWISCVDAEQRVSKACGAQLRADSAQRGELDEQDPREHVRRLRGEGEYAKVRGASLVSSSIFRRFLLQTLLPVVFRPLVRPNRHPDP